MFMVPRVLERGHCSEQLPPSLEFSSFVQILASSVFAIATEVLLTRNVTLPPPRAAQFLWATWAQIPAGRKLVLESQGECRRLRVFVHGLSSAGAIFKIGRGAKLEIRNMEIDSINPCRNSRKCCIYFAISEPPHPLTSVGLQLSKVKLATHLQHKMLTTKTASQSTVLDLCHKK